MVSQVEEVPAGFKLTELGILPADWETFPLGELFEIKQGKSLSAKQNLGINPRPFLRTANVFWGRIDLSTIDKMDFDEAEIRQLCLKQGDLLVCEGGDIGRTAIWKGELDLCCYQNHLHRLRPLIKGVDPLFYMYWMQEAILQLGFYIGSGNKTTIPNLSQSRLKAFLLPKPEYEEQRAIAHVLSTIQRAIEAQDKVISAARELKKSLMRHLFTFGPVPVSEVDHILLKETEIGEMPDHWEVTDLGLLVDIQYGVQAAVANLKDPTKGIPILTNINITNEGKLDLSLLRYYELKPTQRDKLLLQKGDLLFNWRSGSSSHVGKTALFDIDGEYTYSSFILRFRPNIQIGNAYLYYFLSHLKALDFFAEKRSQSSINSVFNASLSSKIPIAVAPISDQPEIVGMLSAINYKIQSEENRKASLQSLFKTMLHLLMTGQLRVNDLKVDD